MLILTPEAAEVKPATAAEAFFLGFRTELDLIEDDAREMGESFMDEMYDAMSDAEIEAMAGEAHFSDMVDSGEFPW